MAPSDVIQTTEVIGAKGKYHFLAAFTLFYIAGISGAEIYYVQFLTPKVAFYWDWDQESPNRTVFDSDNCKFDQVIHFNRTSMNSTATSRLLYRSQYSRNSITEKFNLVCERSWMISFLKLIPCIAMVVVGCFLGPVTEKFGRKRCSFCMVLLAIVANICQLFAQNYIMFAVSYFVAAGCISNLMPLFMALNTDIVPDSMRPLLGPLLQAGFIPGMCLVPAAAWISQDWFYTQAVLLVYVSCTLPIIWYIEESPSWLVLKGRDSEAKAIAQKIARMNGQKEVDFEQKADLWLSSLKAKQNSQARPEKGKFTDLFRNKIVARYTICLSIAESTAHICTKGIFLNVESFGSGLFEDYFIANAVTLLSIPLVTASVKVMPVKWSQVLYFVMLGIVCALYPFVYVYSAGRMATTVLGRVISAPIVNVNIAYTAEVFPNSVRVIGQAVVISFSRIFAALAPFTKELGERTAPYVPFVLFCALSFVSVLMFLFLPNTSNKPLAHTVQELTRIGSREAKPSVDSVSSKL